ncbi:ABC transporter permease [Spiroplasma endosymbiont of Amphibalanus improvisus]|uniref:ABC transporter permease n=1 Tax=Spiroplasma endosymbiont of Amphibalanus improvisus TaxID=3066327 RepID=UPI00313EC18F
MSRLFKNIIFEFQKIKITYIVFAVIFLCIGVSFFALNYYQPTRKVVIIGTSFYSGRDVSAAYEMEQWVSVGVVSFFLLSLMSMIMINRFFISEKKDKTMMQSMMLPLSRNEIILSKILVVLFCVISLPIAVVILESFAFLKYNFGQDNGWYYYGVTVLNYFNFIAMMVLTVSIYFLLALLISKLSLVNWILTLVFIIFTIVGILNIIYFSWGSTPHNTFYNFLSVTRFFGPQVLMNSYNLSFVSPGDPTEPGTYFIISQLVDNNLVSSSWDIPIALAGTAGIIILNFWYFNTHDLDV